MNSEEFPVQLSPGETVRVDRFIASLGLFSRSQIGKRSVIVRDASGGILKFSRQLKDGDTIYYDKHAGHGISWKDKLYHVIRSGDVVLVE